MGGSNCTNVPSHPDKHPGPRGHCGLLVPGSRALPRRIRWQRRAKARPAARRRPTFGATTRGPLIMATDAVQYRLDDRIATIRIDDGKRNALSPAVLREIYLALDQAESDRSTVIITGREE